MAATKQAQLSKQETKDFITTGLLQLLKKETLSSITISQVCICAGVSRMAFYRNYNGLEQILYEYYQPKIANVFELISQKTQFNEKRDIQLDFFKKFGDDLLASINRGFEPIIQRIFIEEIKKFYISSRDTYWIAFMSAGVYAIWQKWLLDGQQIPLIKIMLFLKQFDGLSGIDHESIATK